MTYFNADGSHASMCGNAALCSTRLAARLGLAHPDLMRLETDAGTYESRTGPDGDRAELHLAPVGAPVTVPGLTATEGGERQLVSCTVGVPHLVVLVDDVARVEVTTRGKALRSHPSLGPAGANANFISPGDGQANWHIRTYERGVEDETLACGTGAVAAACALIEWGLAEPPLTFHTRSGRELVVRARKTPGGGYDDVWLGGEARLVLRGVIN
jgi:diaminopimelate epimerase